MNHVLEHRNGKEIECPKSLTRQALRPILADFFGTRLSPNMVSFFPLSCQSNPMLQHIGFGVRSALDYRRQP